MKSMNYETLNQVQGDKIVTSTQPPLGKRENEFIHGFMSF